MRRLLRDIAEGRALGDVTTLRDPAVMGQLEDRVKELQAQEDGTPPSLGLLRPCGAPAPRNRRHGG
jgi:hypothetical protein